MIITIVFQQLLKEYTRHNGEKIIKQLQSLEETSAFVTLFELGYNDVGLLSTL